MDTMTRQATNKQAFFDRIRTYDEIPKSAYFIMLIEEYKQMYSDIRIEKRISFTRQALFISISFGIIAYTLEKDIGKIGVLFSGTASSLLYFLAILVSESEVRYNMIRYRRLREIEGEFGRQIGLPTATYNLNFQTNWIREQGEAAGGIVRRQYNPRFWARRILKRDAARTFISFGLYLVICLWLFRLL